MKPNSPQLPYGGKFSPQRWLFSSVFPHREEEMINKCLNTFYWRPFADYYVWLKYLKQGSDCNIIYFLPSNRAQCENLASEREFIFRLQNTMQIKEITTCWKRALNQLVTDEINSCSQSELQHLKHMFWQHIRCICPHLVAKESSGIYRNNWQTPMYTQDTSDQWELVKFSVDLGLSTGFTANPNTSIT